MMGYYEIYVVKVILLVAVTSVEAVTDANIVYLTEDGLVYQDVSSVDILSLNISINLTTKAVDISGLDSFSLQRLLCELVSSGTVVFAATISCERMKYVAPVLSLMKIPLVNIGPSCQWEDGYDLDVIDYFESKSNVDLVLSDVMHLLKWRDVFVIYDHGSATYLNTINDVLMEQNVTTENFKVEDPVKDVSQILKYVEGQKGAISKFMVICNIDCIKEIFSQANDYDRLHDVQGLFTYSAQWLVILDDSRDVMTVQQSVRLLDHVSVVTPTEQPNISDLTVLQDVVNLAKSILTLFDNTSQDVMQKVSMNNSCGEKLYISEALYSPFQDSFSAGPCMNCTEYYVKAAFYKPGKQRVFQAVGEWTRDEYIVHGRVFPNTAFGFNGRYFYTATNIWDPFVRRSTNSSSGFEGLCISLLEELATNLNFTYNLTIPEDNQWGAMYNGSWTGLVGELEKKKVDLTVAPLGGDVDREKVMDFTEAFFLEYQTVLVRYKNSESDKWRLYLEPFQWESWLSFIAAIPVGALAIWLVTRLTPYYQCHGEESLKKADKGLGRLENAMFFSFGAFFQQGSVWLPDSQSGRFIVGFWWMYCIVVMATYSGNLIAYLTVTKTALPFDTVSEMLAQDAYKFGTMGGTVTEHKLKNARDGNDKAMWAKISAWEENDPGVLNTNHSYHIERTVTDSYAYIQDRTSFELETSRRCDIGIISENFLPLEYGLGLQNNSYFEKPLSLEVIKIRETGLLNKWKVEWWPRQSFCSTGTQTVAKAVSLTDVQGAYYVMAILLTCALIALLTETILHLSKFKKMTGKHSGDYRHDSHSVQVEMNNGEVKTSPIDSWEGFDSVTAQTRIHDYGGMFNSDSRTQLTVPRFR